MELEKNGSIHFLDFFTIKKQDGYHDHEFYRKKTHIEDYLHAEYHYHPSQNIQNISVLGTLTTRDIIIFYEEHYGNTSSVKKITQPTYSKAWET